MEAAPMNTTRLQRLATNVSASPMMIVKAAAPAPDLIPSLTPEAAKPGPNPGCLKGILGGLI